MSVFQSPILAITGLSLACLAVPGLADSPPIAATGSGSSVQPQAALPELGSAESAKSDSQAAPEGQYTQAQINEMINNPLGVGRNADFLSWRGIAWQCGLETRVGVG